MSKSLAFFFTCVALLLGAGAARAQEPIAIGEQSWTGARAIGFVLKSVIETRLGGKAELKKADLPAMFAAMDKGDGSIDIVPDLWMPNQFTFWEKFIKGSATVKTNGAPYKGTANLCVPKYVRDKHGVRSVADLSKPEVAKLFDSDANGKGEYWPGASGWASTNVWSIKFKSHGLTNNWEATIVDDQLFRAKLDAAYKKQQPILFYCWTPEWVTLAYDLVTLDETPFTGYSADNQKEHPLYKADGCFKMYQPKDRQDWLEASSITCANPANEVWVAYSKSLEKRNPKVAKFLSQVRFDTSDVGGWIMAIGRDKKDPQDVAEAWLKANSAKVDGWLKGI